MIELLVTAALFLIPVLVACIFARIYNVTLGFITYLLFSYLLLKLIQAVDVDLLITINAEETLYYYQNFIQKVFIAPVVTLVNLIPSQEIREFLYLDLVQYSLLIVIYLVVFVLSVFLRKRRIRKYKKR